MESVNTSEINIEERIAAESLVIDIDGFEGPLDVLLTLARTQKVDMRKISILQFILNSAILQFLPYYTPSIFNL